MFQLNYTISNSIRRYQVDIRKTRWRCGECRRLSNTNSDYLLSVAVYWNPFLRITCRSLIQLRQISLNNLLVSAYWTNLNRSSYSKAIQSFVSLSFPSIFFSLLLPICTLNILYQPQSVHDTIPCSIYLRWGVSKRYDRIRISTIFFGKWEMLFASEIGWKYNWLLSREIADQILCVCILLAYFHWAPISVHFS